MPTIKVIQSVVLDSLRPYIMWVWVCGCLQSILFLGHFCRQKTNRTLLFLCFFSAHAQ